MPDGLITQGRQGHNSLGAPTLWRTCRSLASFPSTGATLIAIFHFSDTPIPNAPASLAGSTFREAVASQAIAPFSAPGCHSTCMISHTPRGAGALVPGARVQMPPCRGGAQCPRARACCGPEAACRAERSKPP